MLGNVQTWRRRFTKLVCKPLRFSAGVEVLPRLAEALPAKQPHCAGVYDAKSAKPKKALTVLEDQINR